MSSFNIIVYVTVDLVFWIVALKKKKKKINFKHFSFLSLKRLTLSFLVNNDTTFRSAVFCSAFTIHSVCFATTETRFALWFADV